MNVAASGLPQVEDINPATGEAFFQLSETDLSTLPDIIARAREAQAQWAARSFCERARHITLMRRYVVDHAEQIASIVSQSNGKTRVDALAT